MVWQGLAWDDAAGNAKLTTQAMRKALANVPRLFSRDRLGPVQHGAEA
jgi:hypothetical protein